MFCFRISRFKLDQSVCIINHAHVHRSPNFEKGMRVLLLSVLVGLVSVDAQAQRTRITTSNPIFQRIGRDYSAPAPQSPPKLNPEAPRIAKDPWRILDGKTNIESESTGWIRFSGKVTNVHPGGVMLSGYYGPSFNSVEPTDFFVANFPYSVAEEDRVGPSGNAWYLAKPAGTYTYTTVLGGSRTVHKLDYGEIWTPPTPPPPTPEQVAAARAEANKRKANAEAVALKWNLDQAAKGDAYGQFRMGQRYLTGDGVETNVVLAKEMFEKAAAQGHEGAKSELARMAETR